MNEKYYFEFGTGIMKTFFGVENQQPLPQLHGGAICTM